VVAGFEGQVPVIDGGQCADGLESTIIAVSNDSLIQLRSGALARRDIEQALDVKIKIATEGGAIIAPGMLTSHYAPNNELQLNVTKPDTGVAYLAFGAQPEVSGPVRNLSSTGDLQEAARNLFAYLHELDVSDATITAAAPIPNEGLGEAINDRLQRAAQPKS
jgi:L-threonylcarbamoyladenylate synthase